MIAALGWGAADFLVRFAGRREGVLRTMAYGQVAGLALLTAWAAVQGGLLPGNSAQAPAMAWVAAIAAAPLNLAATYALFRALATGTVAVVSPIAASYGAITAALSALTGERPGLLEASGMALAVVGVALASASGPGGTGRATGVGGALLAAMGYGVGFWLMGGWAVPSLGPLLPIWLYYAGSVATLSAMALATGGSLRPPPIRRVALLLGIGLIGTAAYLAFSVGLATGQVAVTTVVSSLSSGVTVLLAFVVLRDRLRSWQWAGVASILAGVVLLHAAG